jgi:hypothetical protein
MGDIVKTKPHLIPRFLVTAIATLTGNFPGSPVSLDFHFTIKSDKIDGLTIG